MPKDTNSVNDEIRNERRKVLENMGTKDKIKYFVGYYKWPVIFIIIGVIGLGSLIKDFVTRKDVIFECIVVNGRMDGVNYEGILAGFDANLDYDRNKEYTKIEYDLQINPESAAEYDQASSQKVVMQILAGDVNVIICDEAYMNFIKEQGGAANLIEVLPKEMLDKYSDRLVYGGVAKYDGSGLDSEDEDSATAAGEDEEVVNDSEAAIIDISDFNKIKESNMFPDGKAYAFLIDSEKVLPLGIEFLKYLDE